MRRRTYKLGLVCLVVFFALSAVADQHAEKPQALTILLSNDDGYDAPGLRALAEALAPLGRLIVVAPLDNQSGTGHGTTSRQFVLTRRVEIVPGVEGHAVAARPATCVRLALETLLAHKPDLVVSGINRGTNLGLVTYYSGTVAGAREAAFLGIPALAVSLQGDAEEDYARTAAFVAAFIRQLHKQGRLRPGLFLNINAPAGPQRGIRATRQSTTPTPQLFERYTNPRGEVYFWSDYRSLRHDKADTDVWAVLNGFVSITSLQIDQTRTADLDWLQEVSGETVPATPR